MPAHLVPIPRSRSPETLADSAVDDLSEFLVYKPSFAHAKMLSQFPVDGPGSRETLCCNQEAITGSGAGFVISVTVTGTMNYFGKGSDDGQKRELATGRDRKKALTE